MLIEKQKVNIYLERAGRDYQDELQKYEMLKKQIVDNDGNADVTNDRLRVHIEKMKKEMEQINNYSIDIAKDPSKTI